MVQGRVALWEKDVKDDNGQRVVVAEQGAAAAQMAAARFLGDEWQEKQTTQSRRAHRCARQKLPDGGDYSRNNAHTKG